MDLDVHEIARRIDASVGDGLLRGRIRLKLFEAPIRPKSAWTRDGDRFLICVTLGSEFADWHRRVVAEEGEVHVMIAQAIAAAAVEKAMDEVEEEIRGMLRRGMRLGPRRTPGRDGTAADEVRDILDKLDATRRLGVSMSESRQLAPHGSAAAVCDLVGG